MNEYTVEFFAATTADDQQNYFSGEVQEDLPAFLGEGRVLPAGHYRVIGGELCHVLTGLPTEDVRSKLRLASQAGS